MTFYYYCFLVVLPLRLEWKTREKKARAKNPINVNVVATNFQNKNSEHKNTRGSWKEKLKHFLRDTALRIKFIL